MNLKQRIYSKELLDGDNIPFEDIKRNMEELDFINTKLGGHNITIKGFKKLLGNKKRISVCEIGCGGGDNLVAIAKWCTKRGIDVHCTGIDIKQECIAVAKTNNYLRGFSTWITSDYKEVFFERKPDIIFSSLFCHHFTEDDLSYQLQWMEFNSNTGFFINDLQRNIVAYYAIKILTKLFSSSYLVKNDAPLSVARGFTKKEWIDILDNAYINKYAISWQWAFRHLIISKNE
jgi:2-polyprenyl-3-methyl-5-hydroxy-6-metoxy-1,4-benzoquinol methylase